MKAKITCIIVDDEETARRGLAALVSELGDIDLIGVCSNGVEAVDSIQALRPQLVFLDVQMPEISGFEVLSSLKKPWPQVIFTTAHDQFAIKAFDINAVDYLLKPFSDERFEEAVRRAKRKIEESKESAAVRDLIKNGGGHLREGSSLVPESLNQKNRLVIKSDGSIHLIDFFSVRYIEAFDYYIKIHVESRFYLLRESMKAIAEKLPAESFVRIHKSFIVNMACVTSLHKLDNSEYEVELKGGEKLKVSRNFKSELMTRLKLG